MRRAANARVAPDCFGDRADPALDAAMLSGPSVTWAEAADKTRFLLDRYAMTPQARDARIQKLIGRAMGDLARLGKCEEKAT